MQYHNVLYIVKEGHCALKFRRFHQQVIFLDTDFWIVFYAVNLLYTSAICRQNNGPTAGDLGAAFVT
jgi:hypothetical protein